MAPCFFTSYTLTSLYFALILFVKPLWPPEFQALVPGLLLLGLDSPFGLLQRLDLKLIMGFEYSF